VDGVADLRIGERDLTLALAAPIGQVELLSTGQELLRAPAIATGGRRVASPRSGSTAARSRGCCPASWGCAVWGATLDFSGVMASPPATEPAGSIVRASHGGSSRPSQNLVMQYAANHRVSPNNIVYGNCGSSYIYVNEKSNGQPVDMDTGFDVHPSAIAYGWHAHIAGFQGSGYSYEYHASGNLANRPGWHGQHSSAANYPHGTYHDYVYSDGSSWALLNNGGYCTSGLGFPP
jgi:hypothetical protein